VLITCANHAKWLDLQGSCGGKPFHHTPYVLMCRWIIADRVDYDTAFGLYRALTLLASTSGAELATCDAAKVRCIDPNTVIENFYKHSQAFATAHSFLLRSLRA